MSQNRDDDSGGRGIPADLYDVMLKAATRTPHYILGKIVIITKRPEEKFIRMGFSAEDAARFVRLENQFAALRTVDVLALARLVMDYRNKKLWEDISDVSDPD